MNGAPKKIHRKQGVNVTHVARRPPSVPASIGESVPGSRNAAMKPTNCTTMISGPGVVSAIPSPSSISPGCSQPNRSTACCATYASTEYAPPNVTIAALLKNTPSCTYTESDPRVSHRTSSGPNHSVRQTALTIALRRSNDGRALPCAESRDGSGELRELCPAAFLSRLSSLDSRLPPCPFNT